MDDLIVIILTLILAVAGALGQLKKKKKGEQAGEQTDEPQVDQPGNFWDFLEEGKEPKMQHQEEPVMDEMATGQETPVMKPEGSAIYKHDLTADAKEKGKKPGKSVKKEKTRDFSLKKAVIYSEILNRKYN